MVKNIKGTVFDAGDKTVNIPVKQNPRDKYIAKVNGRDFAIQPEHESDKDDI